MKPSVVIDTNVLVGAALSAGGGSNREVLRRCLRGDAQPVVALFAEYESVFLRGAAMAKCPLSG